MVEIIPKTPRQYSLVTNILFYASIAAFVLAVGGFWALLFVESKSQGELERLEAALGAKKTGEQQELEREVFLLQAKLKDFASIVQAKKDFLPAFTFFEDTVHPQVTYSSVNLSKERNNAQLQGLAQSFSALEEQILILEQRQEPSRVLVTDITLNQEGEVAFQLELLFPPEFFNPFVAL